MNSSVTVILPVYNAMPYLRDAVASLLAQTFQDFTLLAVDDGSTDGSLTYLRSLCEPRIKIATQPHSGPGAARRKSIATCDTEYIALMDADDVSMPNRMELQVRYLDTHPGTVLLGTQFDFLIRGRPRKARPVPIAHDQIRNKLMRGRAGLCNTSLMFRTQEAQKCLDEPGSLFGEDIDFCLQMCRHGLSANLPEVLVKYRLHDSQVCLARSLEVVRGARYAVVRELCREAGFTIPTFEKFTASASLRERRCWQSEAIVMAQYRRAQLDFDSGRNLKALARLFLASSQRLLQHTLGKTTKQAWR